MKIAYLTAHTPFGRGESFVLEEMLALVEAGIDLLIIPRNPPKEVFHGEATRLLANTVWLPLWDGRMLIAFLKTLIFQPRIWSIIGQILGHSRSLKIVMKNIAILPKATFAARLVVQEKVEHIHAHWGSTTSTMAWAISELTGIPWSMTLHRWDIGENNLLQLKLAHASFVRCISEDGRRETLNLSGVEYQDKVIVIRLGAHVPEKRSDSLTSRSEFIIACPAYFVPVKGHRFLIEACARLVERGFRFKCLLIGDGPLKPEICRQIHLLGLSEYIILTGPLPHERVLHMYETGEVDIVVLPSIVTANGEREGTPAALMEAMAYGIPVVSTSTGGIPEVLRDDSGLLVSPGTADELADALALLMSDEQRRKEVAERGRQRIREEFNWEIFRRRFLEMVKQSCRQPHWS